MIGCSKKNRETYSWSIYRENAFEQKKKKPGLKFNPALALIGLRTTGPCMLMKMDAKTPLFVWNNNFETDDKKKGGKEHYKNKVKLIRSVLFYSFFFQLLIGKYVGNVKMKKLSRPITARHVRISPQYWERGLCTKIDLLGCGIGSSGNRKSKVAFG